MTTVIVHLYTKYGALAEAGVHVSLPVCPSPALTAWNSVSETTQISKLTARLYFAA